jgi:hypothetical protein
MEGQTRVVKPSISRSGDCVISLSICSPGWRAQFASRNASSLASASSGPLENSGYAATVAAAS